MRSAIADRKLAQVLERRKQFAQSRQADNMGQLRLSFMWSFIHSSGCGDVYQSPTEPARATHQAGDDERRDEEGGQDCSVLDAGDLHEKVVEATDGNDREEDCDSSTMAIRKPKPVVATLRPR